MREGVSNIYRDRMFRTENITYTISAKSVDAVVPTLARIRNDVLGEFQKAGCEAHVLDGTARLKLMHSLLRPYRKFLFSYDEDITLTSGLSTKDCIVPMSLDFKPDGDMSCFKSNDKWCQVLVMRRFNSELSDRALSDTSWPSWKYHRSHDTCEEQLLTIRYIKLLGVRFDVANQPTKQEMLFKPKVFSLEVLAKLELKM